MLIVRERAIVHAWTKAKPIDRRYGNRSALNAEPVATEKTTWKATDAELFRRMAAHAQRLIAFHELPGGRGDGPDWPQAKAALLDLARQWEGVADNAERAYQR